MHLSFVYRLNFRKDISVALVFLCTILSAFQASAQLPGLIVNEISNGASGAEEYMEFLTIGCPGGTVNLRGYIIDDNNGTFNSGGAGSGVGIATGHYRFSNSSTWAAVPIGSIILIYNPDDKNHSIRLNNDPVDANQDKVYVLPVTSNLLEVCITNPNTTSTGYSCVYAPGLPAGSSPWGPLGMSNTSDAGQVRNPNGTYYHGISYGNAPMNGGPDGLNFSGSGSGRVFFFNAGNFRQLSNFSSGTVPADETPGEPNNPANRDFVNNLRSPFTGGTIASDQNICAGADPAEISQQLLPSGPGPFTYQWESSVTGATTGFTAIPGATAATYDPPVLQQDTWFRRRTSVTGCAAGFSNVVSVRHAPVPDIVPSVTSLILCNGQNVDISFTSSVPGAAFSWTIQNPGGVIQGASAGIGNAIHHNLRATTGGLHTLVYSVTASANGCSGTPVEIPVMVDLLVADAGPDVTIPAGGQTTLQGSGGGNYRWYPATGLDNPDIANPVASPDLTTTYTLRLTSPFTNCTFYHDSVTVFVQQQLLIPNIITPNGDQINDRFEVKGLNAGTNLVIYNRWGTRIFNTGNYQNTWAADGLSGGIYYYILTDTLGKIYKGWLEIVK